MVDAVVADEGIAHHNALPRVRGVGQNFLVACHGGVEDHLAHAVCRGADALPPEDAAVGQNQGCLHQCYPAFLFRSPMFRLILTQIFWTGNLILSCFFK